MTKLDEIIKKNGDAMKFLEALSIKKRDNFERAKIIADIACELDGHVETMHLVEPLHDIAMELSGDRVNEIYDIEATTPE